MRIAIIGASADREKYGNKAVRAYIDRGWEVFPVNPKEKIIEGLKCYASIKDIPGKLDYASLYVPPAVVEKLVDDIIAVKVPKVYFNPGTESDTAIKRLKTAGITPLLQCSIVAIGLSPSMF